MSLVLVNVSVAACTPFPALLFEERVIALAHWRSAGLRGTSTMAEFLDNWASNADILKALRAAEIMRKLFAEHGAEVSDFNLHEPVAPRQVYCTIGNYRSQLMQAALDADDGPQGPQAATRRDAALAAIESRSRDGAPYVCLKGSASVSGPYDPLSIEAQDSTLDWEAEIGVVIGHPASHVEPAHALEYIAGYCVVNDITLRDRVFRRELPTFGTDWLQSKSRRGWLPTGPWLVPAWEIEDPSELRPWLRLNGELMQDGVASDMIFGITEQIAYLSTQVSLQPGDLICTGTPAGIGSHYGRYLRVGDVVEAGVFGLGHQRVICTSLRF
ncbi:FAA hydrolase family protein [Pandoraea terrae]|uniref:FAA hydrolase family protein n=1 Tax=Pandoraea terrae TaxID=1537710 RepID=A0A5E4ZCU0_9BURK|nr:fumarylacetoacetate hydrolase family protein [Pandoraea terrae]VVE57993.1 FAA hydrolase family protein [Pandoraea terrae]